MLVMTHELNLNVMSLSKEDILDHLARALRPDGIPTIFF